MNPMQRPWLFLLLMICTSTVATAAFRPKANPDDAQQVARGQLVYQRFCALCHGAKLEGQPEWRTRKPDGKLPATA